MQAPPNARGPRAQHICAHLSCSELFSWLRRFYLLCRGLCRRRAFSAGSCPCRSRQGPKLTAQCCGVGRCCFFLITFLLPCRLSLILRGRLCSVATSAKLTPVKPQLFTHWIHRQEIENCGEKFNPATAGRPVLVLIRGEAFSSSNTFSCISCMLDISWSSCWMVWSSCWIGESFRATIRGSINERP